MYMFDLQSALQSAGVSYQWAIYQDKIGVVMSRLVGMGLKTSPVITIDISMVSYSEH